MLVALLLTALAHAGHPVERRVGATEGLDCDTPHRVVAGQDGFLWVSSPQGVWRFDGRRFEPAVPGEARRAWYGIAARRGAGVYVVDGKGRLAEVVDGRETLLPLPGGATEGVRSIGTEADGALWLALDGHAWRLGSDGTWESMLGGRLLPGERLRYVQSSAGPVVLVTSRGGFQVRKGTPERVLVTPTSLPLTDLVVRADGVWTMEWSGTARHWVDGVQRLEWTRAGANSKFEVAGGRLLLDSDRWVAEVGEDGQIGTVVETEMGSMIDAPDGSVWFTRHRGLGSWPAPLTQVYDQRDGLPSGGARYVIERGGSVWVSTWFGSARIVGGTPVVEPEGYAIVGRFCLDPAGVAYASGRRLTHGDQHDLLASRDGGAQPIATLASGHFDCAVGADSEVWFVGPDRMRGRVLGRVRSPDAVELVPDPPVAPHFLDIDRTGEMWISDHEQLCHTSVERASQGDWRCVAMEDPELDHVTGLVRTDDDQVWVATTGMGLAVLRGDRLVRHARSDAALGTRSLLGIRPSPRGGAWVFGHGALHRLVGPDLTVTERLGRWEGLPASSVGDVAETPEGDLWIATSAGVVHVPAAARAVPPGPPPLRLMDVRVDDRPVSDTVVPVPSAPNRISIRTAALAFRDPARVRYRMQVGRGPFTALADGRVELADLASGEHAVRLQASLDGSLWSDPLTVRIRVATPWWRRPWVLGVALLAGVGLVVLVSRARLAWLLARERERLRIAMDLHDELGSGLGSIRLLATVLRRDRVGDAERVDLARRIERSTGELHGSLSEMVGSLRPGGATGRALVDRLWRRGRDLVVGGGVDLRVVLGAGLESTALPLVVCRDLERIGVEALHNAARHGGAQSVTIGLARAGAQWRLWVRDDGVGFDTSGSSSGGLGLESMRRRAERIGGRLEVTSAPGQGTTVTVHFDPRTHRRGNA